MLTFEKGKPGYLLDKFSLLLKQKITERVSCRDILSGSYLSCRGCVFDEDVSPKLVITGTRLEIREVRLIMAVKALLDRGPKNPVGS